MAAKRPRPAPTAAGPFFQEFLQGEAPLTGATARRLCDASQRIYEFAPWEFIAGDFPIVFDLFEGGMPVLGTVMGNSGDICGLKIYENAYAQKFICDLLRGEPASPEEFMVRRQSLSLDYVPKDELEPGDKGLLKAMDHPGRRGALAPVFRAGRVGCVDWYVTEPEALRLVDDLEALAWLLATQGDGVEEMFGRDEWPWITRVHGQFQVETRPFAPPPVPEEPPDLAPAAALEPFQPFRAKRTGAIELGVVYANMPIGGRKERPRYSIAFLAVDARSGMVLKPHLADAGDPMAKGFTAALLAAAQVGGGVPREIRHRGPVELIRPLADALGIQLTQRAELPRFDDAADGLMRFLRFGGM